MKITGYPCGSLMAVCYTVVTDNTAIIIDPGYLDPTIESFVTENKQKLKYILLTHRHFDHLSAAVALRKMTGAPICIHKFDECGLYSDVDSLGSMVCGAYGTADINAKADILLSDGDCLSAGDVEFRVIHTPGHTVGGVCFLSNNALFSGDTLLKLSIGRTDFPGGNMSEMKRSLDRLMQLSDDITVYPGHGEVTTIGYERQNNPFLFW